MNTHFELFLKEEAADSALFSRFLHAETEIKPNNNRKTDFVSAINQTAAV